MWEINLATCCNSKRLYRTILCAHYQFIFIVNTFLGRFIVVVIVVFLFISICDLKRKLYIWRWTLQEREREGERKGEREKVSMQLKLHNQHERKDVYRIKLVFSSQLHVIFFLAFHIWTLVFFKSIHCSLSRSLSLSLFLSLCVWFVSLCWKWNKFVIY